MKSTKEITLTGEEKKQLEKGAESVVHTLGGIGYKVALDENGRPQVVALVPSPEVAYCVNFPGFVASNGIINRK